MPQIIIMILTIMFCYFTTGCDGWHLGLKKTDNKTLTAADFYKSRLQIRNYDFNIMIVSSVKNWHGNTQSTNGRNLKLDV